MKLKKTLSIILFTVLCLVLTVSVVICFYSIYDINRTLNELANTPGTSGIDYLGIGWIYGICLFAVSVLGLILSGISQKLLQQKIQQYVSIVAMVVFALLLMISFLIFYM